MPDKPIPGTTVEDLSGDKLHVIPRNWTPEGGASLVLEADNPETDTLVYDLPGTIELRDKLTDIINTQQEAGQ